MSSCPQEDSLHCSSKEKQRRFNGPSKQELRAREREGEKEKQVWLVAAVEAKHSLTPNSFIYLRFDPRKEVFFLSTPTVNFDETVKSAIVYFVV